MKEVEDRSRNTAPGCLVELFASRVPEGAKVLDVGCGTGYVSKVLSERGFEVVSVDPKKHRVDYGRKKGRFQEAKITTLEDAEFPDSSFEGVIAVEVIEHVEEPRKFLEEIERVLEPGGAVAIKTPNKVTHDLYQVLFERKFQILRGGELDFHPSVMTPRQLLEMMGETGFSTELLKSKNLPENQERKLGRFSRLLKPLNFRILPQLLQPTLMAVGERR